MTAEELLAVRQHFDWTRTECGAALGCSERSVAYWESGVRKIPRMVAILLRLLYERDVAATHPWDGPPENRPIDHDLLRARLAEIREQLDEIVEELTPETRQLELLTVVVDETSR